MKTNVFILAAISGFIATTAVAQTTAFDRESATADAVEDLEEQIAEDRERDLGRFGNEGREIGTYGSLALRATLSNNDGVTDGDAGLGLRYGFFDGVNGADVTSSYSYASTDGEATRDTMLVGMDYRRELASSYFAYGKGNLIIDNMADEAGDFERDVFLGAGIGYRIVNTSDLQWSVQAGPGFRAAKVVDAPNVEEIAASVSSNLFYSLSGGNYVTNDTDVITSDAATTLKNELALNAAMSDTLSLRTSLTTTYNDATDSSLSDGINVLGVSVVYNFN